MQCDRCLKEIDEYLYERYVIWVIRPAGWKMKPEERMYFHEECWGRSAIAEKTET